ncbi:MAG: 50S ribosomal protein L29 [Candidatus Peregrinibacteria bacterium]|nr:50S ribosomal protein L29 [Candidatus Peregrinibacteria bacterium]
MLTLVELRKRDLKNLMEELKRAREAWLSAKLSVKMDQDKKSHVIQNNKRYIAQVMTVVNEKAKSEPKTAEQTA